MDKDGWGGIILLWALVLVGLLGLAHNIYEAGPAIERFDVCQRIESCAAGAR